jgi:hypothetical protein
MSQQDSRENMKKGDVLAQTICGARLTSVQFVLDYLILGFDERGALTVLVWPEIQNGKNVVKFGMSGYRDCLCELIGQVVRTVKIAEDETILVDFDNNTHIRTPLRDRKAPGERAIFNSPKHHRLCVW